MKEIDVDGSGEIEFDELMPQSDSCATTQMEDVHEY